MTELFEDESIIVILKPRGVVSEAEQAGVKCVSSFFPGVKLFTVHRLDRETQGVMVYAKTGQSAASLSAQIREGGFEKKYYAVLKGVPSEKEGEMSDLLVRDARRNITRIAREGEEGSKPARLAYRILGENQGLCLADIRLFTGRTHQIRIQFSSRSMPVYGDSLYGGGRGELALFAYSLGFNHPVTGERMNFTVRPSPDMFPWNLFEEELR